MLHLQQQYRGLGEGGCIILVYQGMYLGESMHLMKTQCLESEMARHCKALSNFSKNPSVVNIDSIMKSILALCNQKCSINVQFDGYIKCSICNRIGGDKGILICSHIVHPSCLQNKAKTISNQSFDPDMLLRLKCQECNRIIEYQELVRIIGRNVIQGYQKQANDKLIQEMRKIDEEERKEALKRLNFECGLCLGETLVSEGITMSCENNHRFCQDCAKAMILQQIADGKFETGAVKCAAEGCDESLSEQLIKHCVGDEEYFKYTNLQYKNLKAEGVVMRPCNGYIYKNGEKLVEIKEGLGKKEKAALQDEFERKCNAIQSGNVAAAELKGEVDPCPAIISFHPEENREGGVLKCVVCTLQCCIKGCTSAHRGNTCEKFREWEETNKKGTQLSFEQIRALGMAQCQNPKCRIPILRSAGCDWIKCRCGFQNCYVCSKAWTLDDIHVKARGGHAPFDVQKFLREHP